MIAGTLGVLREPAADPLEDHYDAQRGLDVEWSHQYLDGHRVQSGTIAGDVSVQEERVHVTHGEIDIETVDAMRTVATDFVADVEADGWILAERTWATDDDHRPDWPFSTFQTLTGQEIVPMGFDVGAFADAQDESVVEMTTIEGANGVRINWERDPGRSGTRANTGVALRTTWAGASVRLVVYASGYVAIWEPSDWEPERLGRFVHEELMPVAHVLDEDSETAEKPESVQTEVTGDD